MSISSMAVRNLFLTGSQSEISREYNRDRIRISYVPLFPTKSLSKLLYKGLGLSWHSKVSASGLMLLMTCKLRAGRAKLKKSDFAIYYLRWPLKPIGFRVLGLRV